jgi:hypothetical protein
MFCVVLKIERNITFKGFGQKMAEKIFGSRRKCAENYIVRKFTIYIFLKIMSG